MITAMGMKGNKTPHIGSSSTHVSKENDKRRSELFHIIVVSKHTKIETLFDPGSQVNLISESIVKKLYRLNLTPSLILLDGYVIMLSYR